MTERVYVDRSRYEDYQRCNRKRFLAYHEGPQRRGIDSVRKPLPLAVGGSVHEGLAHLIKEAQGLVNRYPGKPMQGAPWMEIEEEAVVVALHDFAQYKNILDVDITESQIVTGAPSLIAQLQDSLGQDSSAQREQDGRDAASARDEYLYAEQSALVEALVRAYARRRLRPLLEQFEMLEVEREGEWLLAEGCGDDLGGELWFMSRPDALLLERDSRQLYLLSFKTTGSWDIRKARDAEHDMQGMSEGIEVERRLAEWWRAYKVEGDTHEPVSQAMHDFLVSCDAPPRIHAVRYEYLLKGDRWKDRDLSERFGVEMRSQHSHLVRQYVARSVPQKGTAGYSIGDVCWSWDYIRDDGRSSNLAWQNWKSRPVWESGPNAIRDWIDALDDAAPLMSGEDSTMGLEPRMLGYHSVAQAVGVTAQHPLDMVFVPPVVVYRNDDDLRDMIDQMEAQERRVAEGVAAVHSARDEGERRHALNTHFAMSRHACEYPTTCQFARVCYGGEDIRRDPLGSGLYKIRVANHPQEWRRNKC